MLLVIPYDTIPYHMMYSAINLSRKYKRLFMLSTKRDEDIKQVLFMLVIL